LRLAEMHMRWCKATKKKNKKKGISVKKFPAFSGLRSTMRCKF